MSKWRTTYDDHEEDENSGWHPSDDDPLEDDWETSELDEEEDDGTDPCPYCKQPVHHLAIYCPRCENYLSKETESERKEPNWVRWGFVLASIAIILWVLSWVR